MVINRCKRLGPHYIGVKAAARLIDLVLQNMHIPADGLGCPLLSVLVEAGQPNGARPRYDCHQLRDAETAFMEVKVWIDPSED